MHVHTCAHTVPHNHFRRKALFIMNIVLIVYCNFVQTMNKFAVYISEEQDPAPAVVQQTCTIAKQLHATNHDYSFGTAVPGSIII